MFTSIRNSILLLLLFGCAACSTAPVDTFCVIYDPVYDYTDKGLSEKTEMSITKNNGVYYKSCLKFPLPLK